MLLCDVCSIVGTTAAGKVVIRMGSADVLVDIEEQILFSLFGCDSYKLVGKQKGKRYM